MAPYENFNSGKYETDKIFNNYLEKYDSVLRPWKEKKIVLLELGIYKGGSLLLWRDYFPYGTIAGVDLNLPKEFNPGKNIYMYQGNQADKELLSEISKEIAPDGFDIIIDDASHIGELTKIAFWHLFDNHLKPGGLYVIEDWGTGYWDDWYDGRSIDLNKYNQQPNMLLVRFQKILMGMVRIIPWPSFASPLKPPSMPCHSYGMVGFIKQLIDEQAANDVTRKKMSGKPLRDSKFEKIIIKPSLVFIFKA